MKTYKNEPGCPRAQKLSLTIMLSFYFFKREANKRGILLVSLFCLYALTMLVALVKESGSTSWWWTASHIVLVLMTLVSLLTPVLSLFKPGFSYKGHPGMRHSTLMVSGSLIILIVFSIISVDLMCKVRFLDGNQYIFYGLICVLHGVHCLVVYGSLFKGPTSKFGKLYQPYLPIIE